MSQASPPRTIKSTRCRSTSSPQARFVPQGWDILRITLMSSRRRRIKILCAHLWHPKISHAPNSVTKSELRQRTGQVGNTMIWLIMTVSNRLVTTTSFSQLSKHSLNSTENDHPQSPIAPIVIKILTMAALVAWKRN